MHGMAGPTLPSMRDRTGRFHALYREQFAFVWAAARRLGVPPSALDDVTQDVFLTAYRRLDELRWEVSPRAWLYGVTRRVASRHLRGVSRRVRREEALAVVAEPADLSHRRPDAARQLEQLLGRLSAGTRAVWEMVELLGMSGAEVASELGLPQNTVYSRLRLARAQLHEQLTAEDLAACVAAGRAAPPADAPERTWAALVPLLGRAEGAGLAAWLGSHVVGVATTMVGGAVAIVLLRAAGTAPAPHADAPARPVVQDVPAPTSPATVEPRPVDDRLAAEVALLDRADARLAAGDPAGALALLDTHAREFSEGVLVDAREAARAKALCRQGRPQEAEAAVRALRGRYPGSAIARRLKNYACR